MKILVVAVLALFLSVQAVNAQQRRLIPEEATFDGVALPDYRLRSSFMMSVFTRNILNDGGSEYPEQIQFPGFYGSAGFYSKENIKNYYPWMLPYLHPIETLPKLLVINKWNKPVRITFGMPNQLEPLAGPNSNIDNLVGDLILNEVEKEDVENFKKSEIGLALEKQILDFAGYLTDLTGLPVSYVPYDIGDDYAEIRVNLIPLSENAVKEQKHFFKTSGSWPYWLSSWVAEDVHFHGGVDRKFVNGFPFTSYSDRQVDGYLLSNSNNEIQMAFCFIWEGHDLPMIKMLLNECLIRSMGFLNGIETYNARSGKLKSYMTYWNDPEKWGDKETRKPLTPDPNISEFDQYMIKTLYNPALKPGMDYVEAQKILLGVQ